MRPKTKVSVRAIQRQMADLAAQGVTQRAVCKASGVNEQAMSAILHGKLYLGWDRGSRIQNALHTLALELEAKRAASAPSDAREDASAPPVGATPNIRTL